MAKQSKKTKSESDKRYFNGYNGEKQREKRLKRHMKNHPSDVQASKASPVYRRRKPLNKGGWVTRQVADTIYIGHLPGKDENAISVLNGMKPVDQAAMAQFARMIKKTHNRNEYVREDKSKPKLGYAG